jgi:transcriptional regulator with XRE-family HTH domain
MLRERKGWSQVDFADRLKMRQPSVWKLENSKGLPKGPTLFKLAIALGCRVEELLVGVNADYEKAVGHSRVHGDVGDAQAQVHALQDRLKGYETMVTRARELLGELHSTIVAMSPTDREPRRGAIKGSARQ